MGCSVYSKISDIEANYFGFLNQIDVNSTLWLTNLYNGSHNKDEIINYLYNKTKFLGSVPYYLQEKQTLLICKIILPYCIEQYKKGLIPSEEFKDYLTSIINQIDNFDYIDMIISQLDHDKNQLVGELIPYVIGRTSNYKYERHNNRGLEYCRTFTEILIYQENNYDIGFASIMCYDKYIKQFKIYIKTRKLDPVKILDNIRSIGTDREKCISFLFEKFEFEREYVAKLLSFKITSCNIELYEAIVHNQIAVESERAKFTYNLYWETPKYRSMLYSAGKVDKKKLYELADTREKRNILKLEFGLD